MSPSGGAALVLDAKPSFVASKLISELLSGAVVGAISDLKSGDTSALLYPFSQN